MSYETSESFPRTKPLYSRLYKRGPNPDWMWPGVCEVDDTETMYIHHGDWPDTNNNVCRFSTGLQQILASGKWELVMDPDMVVDEGL